MYFIKLQIIYDLQNYVNSNIYNKKSVSLITKCQLSFTVAKEIYSDMS